MGDWQEHVPEALIDALLDAEADGLVELTDDWRDLTGDEQICRARGWLRKALGLEAWR
jgi:hypothetical protein